MASTLGIVEKTTFFGAGAKVGADEYDPRTFKRISAEVDKEQKAAERIQEPKLKNQAQPPKE